MSTYSFQAARVLNSFFPCPMDAIGLNCSLGPDLLAPLLKELCENTRLPVIAKPNAGLPDPVDGHYDMGPEDFAQAREDRKSVV